MEGQGETMGITSLVSGNGSLQGIWKWHRGCCPEVPEWMHGGYRMLTSRCRCIVKHVVCACIVCARASSGGGGAWRGEAR